MGAAAAELQEAERLGYRAGPREDEQIADGYLYRGEQELREFIRVETAKKPSASMTNPRRLLTAAQRDFDRAHQRYEPISGYSKVGDSLATLEHDQTIQEQWEERMKEADELRARARQHPPHRGTRNR